MAGSQYFRTVTATEKQLFDLQEANISETEHRTYWMQIMREDKFLEILSQKNLIGFEKSIALLEEFYPKWVRLHERKENAKKIADRVINQFNKMYLAEICVSKEVCHKLFPEYKGIVQVAQIFSPVVKADSQLIMKLRKVFSFKELDEFEDDKKLIMNFVKLNQGLYISH